MGGCLLKCTYLLYILTSTVMYISLVPLLYCIVIFIVLFHFFFFTFPKHCLARNLNSTLCGLNTNAALCDLKTNSALCGLNTNSALCDPNTNFALCGLNMNSALCDLNMNSALCGLNTLKKVQDRTGRKDTKVIEKSILHFLLSLLRSCFFFFCY